MRKYRTSADVIAYKSKLRFLDICITETLKWDAKFKNEWNILYYETIKRNREPL